MSASEPPNSDPRLEVEIPAFLRRARGPLERELAMSDARENAAPVGGRNMDANFRMPPRVIARAPSRGRGMLREALSWGTAMPGLAFGGLGLTSLVTGSSYGASVQTLVLVAGMTLGTCFGAFFGLSHRA